MRISEKFWKLLKWNFCSKVFPSFSQFFVNLKNFQFFQFFQFRIFRLVYLFTLFKSLFLPSVHNIVFNFSSIRWFHRILPYRRRSKMKKLVSTGEDSRSITIKIVCFFFFFLEAGTQLLSACIFVLFLTRCSAHDDECFVIVLFSARHFQSTRTLTLTA